MAKFDKKLANILTRAGLITEEQRDAALREAEAKNSSVTAELLGNRLVDERALLACVSGEVGLPPVDLAKITLDEVAVGHISQELATLYQVVPLAKIGQILTVAVADPFDVLTLDDVKIVTGCELMPVVSTDVAIKKALDKAYKQTDQIMEDLFSQIAAEGDLEAVTQKAEEEVDLDQINGENSAVVKMVNALVLQALEQEASDIHIEPFEKRLRVRYRVDGACAETVSPPLKLHPAITSRIKIMSNMDIAERRKPQDGKFQMKFRGRQIDFRVSVLPTVHGEKTCIRILDTGRMALSLDGLGFEPQALEHFSWAIKQPYGMILVTGPTGSGKSTTLYSAIKEVVSIEDNITTVEDPVEYQMEGINQVQVSERRGLTFAAALRSILRQDPDTVMIGEIRDTETAEIAIKAALTGHLVLSTLHTNDAPSTITRLVDMGVDPFMVASSVVLVSAQRLLRKLCQKCAEPYQPPVERLLEIGVREDEIEPGQWRRARGCQGCTNGYKGRFAILETIPMTEDIRRIVVDGGSALDIRAKALEGGMITLRRCALLNAMRGKTSIEEVLTMTMDEL